MALAIIFLILSGLLGFLLTFRLKINLYFSERLAWGVVLGFVLAIYLGIIFGPFLTLSLIFLLDIFFLLKRGVSLFGLSFERKNPAFLVLLLVSAFFFAALYNTLWTSSKEGMHLTSIGVWADWAMHLALTNFFATQGFTLVNPLYAEGFLTYPLASDFFSSLLIKLGATTYFSFIVPGFILSISLVILIFFLSFRLTANALFSVLVPFLFFANGGWSYNFVWQDLKSFSFNIGNFLAHLPREYAHLYEFGYQWGNVLVFFFMSQRPFLLGLPLGLIILILILERRFLVAGLLMGLLPIIHIHTFIVLSIVLPFLLLKEKSTRAYLRVFLPAGLLAFLYFAWVILQTQTIRTGSFFSWSPGWLKGNENWFWFWTKNVGALLPLIPIALFSKKIDSFLKFFYLPFLLLFFLGNLIGFQPNLADNNKIFIYWFLVSLILVGHFLTKLVKNLALKILVAALFLSLTLTGILNILWFFQPQSHFLFLTNEELALASFVAKNTPKNSLVLTSDQHNHPVSTLSGRKILMGYRGWLWTYGIDYRQREQEVARMFAGDMTLLKEFEVNYAVIGPSEKEKFKVNEDFFKANFPLFYQSQNYKIYQID